MANLYLISQEVNNGYDTYDSAVVCADSEDEARHIHPRGIDPKSWEFIFPCWANTPEEVSVELIGTADDNITNGVILASFNAG